MNLFICKHCNEEKPSKKSVLSHQSFCKSNPNRSLHDHAASGAMGNVKSRISRKTNQAIKIEKYNANPNLCECCQGPLPYDKKYNKFCSHSCSAKVTNKQRDPIVISLFGKLKLRLHNTGGRVRSITHRCICVHCKTPFWAKKSRKFCDYKCRNERFAEVAKNNVASGKMGGNKNNRAYGWYESPFAGKVWLESSWEYQVAKSLDENNISWIRPNFLPYNDRKYFADFYLTDYDVYLDPKNPHLQKTDTNKLKLVEEQNNIRVIILDKNQLTWKSINNIINNTN